MRCEVSVRHKVGGLRVATLRFMKGHEITAGITPAINLNRDLEPGNDVFNLRLALGIRALPH